MHEIDEVRQVTRPDDEATSERPPTWLGVGAVVLAVITLIASFSLVGGDQEMSTGATTTTLSAPVLPDLLVSSPDGVRSSATGRTLIDECAVKAIADRLGGVVAELCLQQGLVHITASGKRRQLVFDSFYRLDAHYEQAPQPGVVVVALGDPALGDTTSTFVYLTGSETHLSVILPAYTDLDQREQIVSTVGIDSTGVPDEGCLLIELPGTIHEKGCGDDTTVVTMSAIHPFESLVAYVENKPGGATSITIVEASTGNTQTRFEFDETPIELDFTDNWLAIAFETDSAVVTRLLQTETYYFEDIDGLALFQKGPIAL